MVAKPDGGERELEVPVANDERSVAGERRDDGRLHVSGWAGGNGRELEAEGRAEEARRPRRAGDQQRALPGDPVRPKGVAA